MTHLAISLALLVAPKLVLSPRTCCFVIPPVSALAVALGDGLEEGDGEIEGDGDADGSGDGDGLGLAS